VPSSIHHDITFGVAPKQVYNELLDADQFAALTGAPATIEPVEGGSFSLFGGQILGRNVELVDGERVVQAWRVAGWEPGVYSVVRFELRASDRGTELGFDHTGFPTGAHDELDAGWHAMYWEPMRNYHEAS
jgi:activator of HSP90 ATPase